MERKQRDSHSTGEPTPLSPFTTIAKQTRTILYILYWHAHYQCIHDITMRDTEFRVQVFHTWLSILLLGFS